MTNDRIVLTDYQADWPTRAVAEIARLRTNLKTNSILQIEHIGSTAVPGLSSKPIVDLMMLVTSSDQAEALIEPIKSLDYEFWKDNPDRKRLFFVKGRPPAGPGRTHHLHVVIDHLVLRDHLYFRDALRANPQAAQDYAALKQRLATKFADDREAYSRGKDAFIQTILRQIVP